MCFIVFPHKQKYEEKGTKDLKYAINKDTEGKKTYQTLLIQWSDQVDNSKTFYV